MMKNYVNEISKVMANYDIEDIIFDEMFIPDHDIEEFIEIASEILKILN